MENETCDKADADAMEVDDPSCYSPGLNHQVRELIGTQISLPQVLCSTFTVFFLFPC